MPIQRIDGFPSAYAAGEQAGSFLSQAADAAANFACGLYRDFPGAVLPTDLLQGRDPVTTFSRGIWDRLCSPRNIKPPDPVSKLPGGQCKCVNYRYNASFKVSETAPVQTSTGTFVGRGEVIERPEQTSPTVRNRLELFSYNCTNGVENGTKSLRFATNYNREGGFATVAISRVDGSPDTCGSQPPTFPPNVIPPGRGNTTTNINLPGITVPVGVAYVPVTITPTLNISPTINVDLGGLNFQFDLGGVTVNFPDLPASPPGRPSLPGGNTSKPDCPPCPPCPELPPSTPQPQPGDPELPPETPPETPEPDKDAPGILYLEVELTKLPNKLQLGGNGQTVYFAGWIAFRAKSGSYHPRQQIHFKKTIYKAPDGCDGYTYTFTNGAKGTVKFYSQPATAP